MGRKGTHMTDIKVLLQSYKNLNFTRRIWEEKVDGRFIFHHLSNVSMSTIVSNPRHLKNGEPKRRSINIATVACTLKIIEMEVRAFIKSVVIFSKRVDLNLVIFGDELLERLAPWLLQLKWDASSRGLDFTYELHPVWFPDEEWRKMCGLCTTQRLFFPYLLPKTDSLLYLDTDSIVISSLENLWKPFDKMKETEITGLVERAPFPANGWYNKNSRVPFYGKRGVVAGYILMNLNKMRSFDFTNKSMAAFTLHREKMCLADQDILNIIFHDAPNRVLVLDCRYNLMTDNCGKTNKAKERIYDYENKPGPICLCNSTRKEGVHVLHAIRHVYHHREPSFWKFAYTNLLKFNMKTESFSELFKNLTTQYNSLDRPCFDLTGEMMYKNALEYFRN